MNAKEIVFKEFIRNGYARSEGKRIWNISNRSNLHLTSELSKYFLKLLNFEPYRKNIFDVEMNLIKAHASAFVEKMGTEIPINLIDIGCGNGEKAKEFIKAFKGEGKIRYCPVSPDDFLIGKAINNVKKVKFKNVTAYLPFKAGYESLEDVCVVVRSPVFKRNVVLLHGSILASYEIHDFLFNLSKNMRRGGRMIIGNAIRSGERLVGIEKYRNKMFDDWFMILMREIGFNKDELEYDARFGNKRVEGFYRVKKDKKIEHDGRVIEFKEDDEILVAILYKYYLNELEKFFKMYFKKVEIVKDKNDEYILAFCEK